MSLIIEHCFPMGRFHATRWKQSPYEDRFGEWPPSPWRLLRALAARWFQYARELGDLDEKKRNGLLNKLASTLPAFYLPPLSFSGTPIMQYQPTSVEWTDKSKKSAAYKKPQTTKNADRYRTLPIDRSLYWVWEDLDLDKNESRLLDLLLERILYFGRSESYCRLRRIESLPLCISPNCLLSENGSEDMQPVLAPITGKDLNIDALLAITDDKVHLKGRPVPPDTAWFFTRLPEPSELSVRTHSTQSHQNALHCIQFAVGGRIYPPLSHWVKITERFRGNVIRCLSRYISPNSDGRYDRLTCEEKNILSLITGKDGQGKPLLGHEHAFFILWPDDNGFPTRLIVWRKHAFSRDEVEALLSASEKALTWDNSTSSWKLRVVPLPFETTPPEGLVADSKIWISVTPFVPPANRHRFRKNGRLRPNESIESLLVNLLKKQDLPEPSAVTLLENDLGHSWMKLHETRSRRFSNEDNRKPYVRPGFNIRLKFSSSVQGPIILGDSSHFGLGLFVPEEDTHP